jgi:hypothetical protein
MKQSSDPAASLSDLELEAMKKSGELANLLRQIIGDEAPNAYHDWVEATIHVHALQNMILSQVAARAYPERFRLLGKQLPPLQKPEKEA